MLTLESVVDGAVVPSFFFFQCPHPRQFSTAATDAGPAQAQSLHKLLSYVHLVLPLTSNLPSERVDLFHHQFQESRLRLQCGCECFSSTSLSKPFG